MSDYFVLLAQIEWSRLDFGLIISVLTLLTMVIVLLSRKADKSDLKKLESDMNESIKQLREDNAEAHRVITSHTNDLLKAMDSKMDLALELLRKNNE